MIIEITTGYFLSVTDIFDCYRNRKIEVSWWTEDLIKKVSLSGTSKIKKIKIISGTELGFFDKALNNEIYEKAFLLGMVKITAEASLVLGCSDLKIKDRIMSGMEPIFLNGGDPMTFTHWEKRLSASFALPGQMVWEPSIKWAFELLE
jgi:hypothetical protein